jgi:hypothetical protein
VSPDTRISVEIDATMTATNAITTTLPAIGATGPPEVVAMNEPTTAVVAKMTAARIANRSTRPD